MAKLPEPPHPSALVKLGAAVHELPAGTRIWRIYFLGGAHPTTWGQFRAWGPSEARFDHHLAPPRTQARNILYGALGGQGANTALAEVFQATRVVERVWKAPALVAFDLIAPLRLLDLAHAWPTLA